MGHQPARIDGVQSTITGIVSALFSGIAPVGPMSISPSRLASFLICAHAARGAIAPARSRGPRPHETIHIGACSRFPSALSTAQSSRGSRRCSASANSWPGAKSHNGNSISHGRAGSGDDHGLMGGFLYRRGQGITVGPPALMQSMFCGVDRDQLSEVARVGPARPGNRRRPLPFPPMSSTLTIG
jgi:hypothetical protein